MLMLIRKTTNYISN